MGITWGQRSLVMVLKLKLTKVYNTIKNTVTICTNTLHNSGLLKDLTLRHRREIPSMLNLLCWVMFNLLWFGSIVTNGQIQCNIILSITYEYRTAFSLVEHLKYYFNKQSKYIMRTRIQNLDEHETWKKLLAAHSSSPLLATSTQVVFVHLLVWVLLKTHWIHEWTFKVKNKWSTSSRYFYYSYSEGFLRGFLGSFCPTAWTLIWPCTRAGVWSYTQ